MVKDNKIAAGIAGVMAAIIAMKGVTWGLAIGAILFIILENKVTQNIEKAGSDSMNEVAATKPKL